LVKKNRRILGKIDRQIKRENREPEKKKGPKGKIRGRKKKKKSVDCNGEERKTHAPAGFEKGTHSTHKREQRKMFFKEELEAQEISRGTRSKRRNAMGVKLFVGGEKKINLVGWGKTGGNPWLDRVGSRGNKKNLNYYTKNVQAKKRVRQGTKSLRSYKRGVFSQKRGKDVTASGRFTLGEKKKKDSRNHSGPLRMRGN